METLKPKPEDILSQAGEIVRKKQNEIKPHSSNINYAKLGEKIYHKKLEDDEEEGKGKIIDRKG